MNVLSVKKLSGNSAILYKFIDIVSIFSRKLKNKDNIDFLHQISQAKTQNWKIAGPSVLPHQVSNTLGLNKVHDSGAESNYILWQVFAKLIQMGSRLGNVYLAHTHCGCELSGIKDTISQPKSEKYKCINLSCFCEQKPNT